MIKISSREKLARLASKFSPLIQINFIAANTDTLYLRRPRDPFQQYRCRMYRIQKNRSSKSAVVKSISWSRCPDHKGNTVIGAGALTRAARTPLLLSTRKRARFDPPFTVFYPQDARHGDRLSWWDGSHLATVVSSSGVGASLNHGSDIRQGRPLVFAQLPDSETVRNSSERAIKLFHHAKYQ